jgi:uncharacterized protein
MTAERDLGEAIVGGIGVRWVVAPGPPPGESARRVALFLPFLGGDISVALAGADHRITRVAALGSTPDWTRPGMRDLGGSGELIDQGTPGAYGRWLYEQLDPVTHLDHYAHGPAILFEGGQADQHVPMEAAYRFATALADRSPAAGKHISVRVTENLGHREAVSNPDAVDRSLAWLAGS